MPRTVVGEFGGAGESGDLEDISFGEGVRAITNILTALLSLSVQLRDHRGQAQVRQRATRLLSVNLPQKHKKLALSPQPIISTTEKEGGRERCEERQ